ncbi:MAG: zinc ribbon domain-containing protein [Actinomycetota bacterium]|nr:zinc ribbon domain-containing protein [Actinomycetota bacterium]
MASYDYRCRTCEDTFEVQRPMTADESLPRCPAGHPEATRVWSAVSLAGRGAPAPAAGGCCGGGCCR